MAGILSLEYYLRVERAYRSERISVHKEINDGIAPDPYRFRILIPRTANALAGAVQRTVLRSRPADPPLPYSNDSFDLACGVLDFCALSIFLASLYGLTSRWFGMPLGLLAVALCSILSVLTFRDHYYHPWSFWEAAFFAAGLLLIDRERYLLFTALNLLGVTNRETSVFLPLAFFFYSLPDPLRLAEGIRSTILAALRSKVFLLAVANLCLWVLGWIALRMYVGYRPATFTFATAWEGNSRRAGYALFLNSFLLAPLFYWIAAGLPRAPRLIRRGAWILPFYLGLILAIGFWWEIRYWLTVFPLLIPAFLAGITRPEPDSVPATGLPSS